MNVPESITVNNALCRMFRFFTTARQVCLQQINNIFPFSLTLGVSFPFASFFCNFVPMRYPDLRRSLRAWPAAGRLWPLLVTGGLALLLWLVVPGVPSRQLPALVDRDTLFTLAGLLMITGAIRLSGFFDALACHLAHRITSLRLLALFLVVLAALLATFLTNDIALFIVVPLTLSLERYVRGHLTLLVLLEALAVNAGSALTPIGNPQNIFLWHRWDLSFPLFVVRMAPLVAVLTAWLLGATLLLFRGTVPAAGHAADRVTVDRRLFLLSLLLLAAFVTAVELDLEAPALLLLLLIYLAVAPRVVRTTDWGLLLLFLFLFLDTGLLVRLPAADRLLASLPLDTPTGLFFSGALLSQLVSNVPATLLLTPYTSDLHTLTWAVNAGGNGTLVASFANIIALRYLHGRHALRSFHLLSIPFLLVTLLTVWLLFF